jgi:hypothetical protein
MDHPKLIFSKNESSSQLMIILIEDSAPDTPNPVEDIAGCIKSVPVRMGKDRIYLKGPG